MRVIETALPFTATVRVIDMSRSYKKNPVCKDPNNRYMKRFANKTVRHSMSVPDGKAYRKFFQSYNISDYSFRCSLLEQRKYGYCESYQQWNRYYRMK